MTEPDFKRIDQLLHGATQTETDDLLFLHLIAAAPHPDETYKQELEHKLNVKDSKMTIRLPRLVRYLVAILIVSLLIIGTAFAVNTVFNQILESDAGLSAVYGDGKGVELDLSHNIEQFTVEIQWGYADTQRISLAYAITAHDDEHEYTNLQLLNPVLTLENGTEILMRPVGVQMIEDNYAYGTIEGNTNGLQIEEELNGTLTFKLGYAHNEYRTEVPIDSSNRTPRYEDWFLQTNGLNFDISLPYESGYTIQLDLNDEDTGIMINLREFSVAPSQGYATVCFTPPERPTEEQWVWSVMNAQLQFNGEQVLEWAGGRAENGCAGIRLVGGLPLEAGTWTLTISLLSGTRTRLPDVSEIEATIQAIGGDVHQMGDEAHGISLPEGGAEALGWAERIEGEWSFTFEVP